MKALPQNIQAAIKKLDQAWKEYNTAPVRCDFESYCARIRNAKRELMNVLTLEVL